MVLLTDQLRQYIPKRVGKELLQMSLLLLIHRQNYRWYSVGDMLYLLIEILTKWSR
jgi:hypothetical protein